MDLRSVYGGRRVLVTGAAGFLGSHLVDALVGLGAEVIALDSVGRRSPTRCRAGPGTWIA